MKRVKDTFLSVIQRVVPLQGKDVLDIGCGNGSRTAEIAQVCAHVSGVDPDPKAVRIAQRLGIANCEIFQKSADRLWFKNAVFDVVIFTLSYHHIQSEKMNVAIDEAIRVLRPDGSIVFFEPTWIGTFFEAEITFGAFDGDERRAKALAYAAMLAHPGLIEIAELHDETQISFDSLEDFIESTHPTSSDHEAMRNFLGTHARILTAQRRFNIFTVKPLVDPS
ncbi:MAG: class I SAM-dependent methyltransferase [Patescibacteria group bacterium]